MQSMMALFGTFGSNPMSWTSWGALKRRLKRKSRPWHTRANKMRRRRSLAYHLMCKCRRRMGLMTLDVPPILLLEWRKHKQWKTKNAKSRSSYRRCHHHFFKPASKISNITLHNWCHNSGQDFTQLPWLLNSLNGTQQFHEWNHQSTAQTLVDRLNVLWCRLENNADQCNLRIPLLFGIQVLLWA